jgi:hypothetical protein
MITKDFRTYSIKILRQDKSLRDHWPRYQLVALPKWFLGLL